MICNDPHAFRELYDRLLDDLDYARAAERLDATPAAVRVRVHRGLASLRDHFTNSMEAR